MLVKMLTSMVVESYTQTELKHTPFYNDNVTLLEENHDASEKQLVSIGLYFKLLGLVTQISYSAKETEGNVLITFFFLHLTMNCWEGGLFFCS